MYFMTKSKSYFVKEEGSSNRRKSFGFLTRTSNNNNELEQNSKFRLIHPEENIQNVKPAQTPVVSKFFKDNLKNDHSTIKYLSYEFL